MSQNYTSEPIQGRMVKNGFQGNDCRICSNVTVSDTDEKKESWDTVLFETSEFVCTPTVGSLVEGYVLIIPKSHYLCAGELPEGVLSRYWTFTKSVAQKIREEFGTCVIFEHGPAETNTQVGCGVDHAHMHIVPIDGNLRELAAHLNSTSISWEPVTTIGQVRSTHQAGKEYLFYSSDGDSSYIGMSPNIDSQLFRKAIANKLGMLEKFDWNDHKFEEKAIQTVRRLQNEMLPNQVLK